MTDECRQAAESIDSRESRLARALGYPYPAPESSFLLIDGVNHPLPPGETAQAELANRIPVLGFGSNRAPEQLARKFQGWPRGTRLPVTRALITDWDVVYGSHIALYGSLPACLIPSSGTTAAVAINWLTPAQLDRMHETEGANNYAFSTLNNVTLTVDNGEPPSVVHYYRPLHKPFTHDGVPVALSAVRAWNRRWPECDQCAVQKLLRDRFAPDQALEDFVWDGIVDSAIRDDRTRRLREE